MKKLKNILTSVIALAMCSTCLMSTPLQVSAASTYAQGDVNGDGSVNSADTLALTNFLQGKKGATGSSIPERLDVNGDFVINSTDTALLRKIVLHLESSSTLNYTSTKDTVTQTNLWQYELCYSKFNAQTGSVITNYEIPQVSNISATSTRGIIGDDDRYVDYSQSGVVLLTNGEKIIGTGFIVDKDKIVTAAHVLYNTVTDEAQSNIKYILFNSTGNKIDINGNVQSDSYMGISANSYHIPKCYMYASYYEEVAVNNNNPSELTGNALAQGFYNDYALIKVNEDLSSYQSFDVGVFRDGIVNKNKQLYVTGYNTADNETNNNINSALRGKMVTGIGYLHMSDSVKGNCKISDKNIFYDVDIINGQSGGPVYIKNSDGSKTVVGINTGSGSTFNTGTKFNTKVLTFIFNNTNF